MGSRSSVELYKKHRPTKFSDIKGQDSAVKTLLEMGKGNKFPHCLMLSGDSGCGKTTIARIVGRCLGCSDADLVELNCASDARGIDTIREINEEMIRVPLGGRVRVYLLDEAHKLTTDAQSGLLKMLEDTPKHVYFILATTDPQKIIKTIHTRATHIQLRSLKAKEMRELLLEVSAKENFHLSDEVCDKIIQASEGSPRKALVLLDQILCIEEEEEQLAAISVGISSTKSIDLARKLFDPKAQWKDVADILKDLDDDPESVRRVILGYAQSVILKGGKMAERAAEVLYNFREPTYNVGKPGLVRVCWDTVHSWK